MIGAMVTRSKVRKSFGTFAHRDLEAFMGNFLEQAEIIYPNNLKAGGEVTGKTAIREWYRADWEQFPHEIFKVKNVCVDNIFAFSGTNVVTVEWSVEGRNRNNEEFTNNGISVIHLVKGKIARMRVYIFDLEVAKRVWGD